MNLGLRDLATHLTTVRDTYPRVKAKGYHVIYREFEDMGFRSYYPPSNDDSIAWATRLRNKNIEPSPEEQSLLKAYSSDPTATVTDGYFPALALVGGAPAGDVLQKLFQSKDANIRAAAAETGSHGLFGEKTVAAMAQLIADPSPKVRQAAIRALGMRCQLAIASRPAGAHPTRHEQERRSQRPPQRHGCAGLCGEAPGAGRPPGSADVPGVGFTAGRQGRAGPRQRQCHSRAGLPARKCYTAVEGPCRWMAELAGRDHDQRGRIPERLRSMRLGQIGTAGNRLPRQPRIVGAGGSVLHGRERAAGAEPGNRPADAAGSAGGIPIHASGR